MTRVLSCIQRPAMSTWAAISGRCGSGSRVSTPRTSFHGIVDLHALTVTETPDVVGEQTINLAAMLFAVGLDPDVATVFVQSHVPEHSQLGWVMECTVSYGELSRMTQFKDKSAKRENEFISAGLFTYPRTPGPPTSCSTTPTRCPSVTISANTSRSPATSPSGSTTDSVTPW